MMSHVNVRFFDNLQYFVGQSLRTSHDLHALKATIGFQQQLCPFYPPLGRSIKQPRV